LFLAARRRCSSVRRDRPCCHDRDFTIVNGTGYRSRFVGVNAPGDEVWNENELSSTIADAASKKVKFSARTRAAPGHQGHLGDDNSSSFFRGPISARSTPDG